MLNKLGFIVAQRSGSKSAFIALEVLADLPVAKRSGGKPPFPTRVSLNADVKPRSSGSSSGSTCRPIARPEVNLQARSNVAGPSSSSE